MNAPDVRRFDVYGASRHDAGEDGEHLGAGAEFPDGTLVVSFDVVAAPPSMFDDVHDVCDIVTRLGLTDPDAGGDVWVEYEDGAEGGETLQAGDGLAEIHDGGPA